MTDLSLRDSTAADIPAIARIYAHWVRHGSGSFETEPPDEAEMARRREAILVGGYAYLVAVDAAGTVLGYAYASAYRTRPAYRFTVENSIYVSPEAGRRGIGRLLLQALMARCEALGYRLMVAVIGDSGNAGSIGVHKSCGFAHAGLLPAIGWKQGRWLDCVLMTCALGEGASTAPD